MSLENFLTWRVIERTGNDELKIETQLLLTLSGGTAGLLLLDACGANGLLSPVRERSSAASSLLDTPEYQQVMLQNKLIAVSDGTTLVVRDDFKTSSTLLQHLRRIPNNRTSMITPTITNTPAPGGGGGSGPLPSPTPGNDSGCQSVGQTCDGLKVIAVVTAGTNLVASTFDNLDGGYDTFGSGYEPSIGSWITSAQYTVERMAQCLESDIANVESDMLKVATELVGGALGGYINKGALSYVLNSARGLVAGTVSAWGFWDVLAAATTVITLPELLTAAGVGVAVGTAFEVGRCALQG